MDPLLGNLPVLQGEGGGALRGPIHQFNSSRLLIGTSWVTKPSRLQTWTQKPNEYWGAHPESRTAQQGLRPRDFGFLAYCAVCQSPCIPAGMEGCIFRLNVNIFHLLLVWHAEPTVQMASTMCGLCSSEWNPRVRGQAPGADFRKGVPSSCTYLAEHLLSHQFLRRVNASRVGFNSTHSSHR